MALFTGMRRSELFRLKWENINFETGFIYIKNPKSGIDEKIPLNQTTREILNVTPKSDSPNLFPNIRGGQLTDAKWAANKIKKKAGLPDDFRPIHGQRHVFASTLASSGKVDLYTLQKLFTHKDHRSTQRYAHLRDETLKKGSSVMDEILNPTKE